jgi:hypothetical protein
MATILPNNPYFENKAPFQIRRGTIAQIQQYVPASGEFIYSTTTNQVFIGTGSTPGGILVSGGGGGNLDFGTITSPAGFTLDLGSI